MRYDKYDIVIDAPHFASWWIANLGHEALVKLPGKLQFLLLTEMSNTVIDNADKLIAKKSSRFIHAINTGLLSKSSKTTGDKGN